MPIGIIVNALSVALGGVIGMLFGSKVPEKIKTELIQIFGVCGMGMGISSIVLMKNMPAVIFSVVVGSAIGLLTGLGNWVNKGAEMMQKPVAGLFKNQNTGIYGSLDSGISGDHTILISKPILDFFTALVFGSNLGLVVSVISIPQCLIFLVIFAMAKVIVMPISWFWANCILPYL